MVGVLRTIARIGFASFGVALWEVYLKGIAERLCNLLGWGFGTVEQLTGLAIVATAFLLTSSKVIPE